MHKHIYQLSVFQLLLRNARQVVQEIVFFVIQMLIVLVAIAQVGASKVVTMNFKNLLFDFAYYQNKSTPDKTTYSTRRFQAKQKSAPELKLLLSACDGGNPY